MSKRKITRNKEEKIALIYDTFFKLIVEKGYHRTSTNKIAKAAQISIGTIYHYFPNGKLDILMKYFERAKDVTLNIEDFKIFDDSNIPEIFKEFISRDIENQRKNLGFRIALRHAILSEEKVRQAFQNKVLEITKDVVKQLRGTTMVFKKIPENRLIKRFAFIYNLIESLVHHHIFIMDLFDNDDDLVKYISNLIAFTIKYFQNSS
ncbi:MAG: TetR/AcrR family transcriptional regulator [Candidatus Hermodarchaeota archaeon]